MLQLKNIKKEYKTGTLVQKALDDVSLNLRDNEFVAILGPSGSGKTTLLNIIGGLDRYDEGDLIINGVSTKKYKDRDWDTYRNHTIGFVFQSYNLILHQSVLSNVELALTISGISRKERRRRAKEALEKVGLGDQIHKKPSQMSGGQMQRVAIARALVNNPDVLLADEPTGALDSETSTQVMELLKEVAKDRLVVMVTHNPDLAYEYANRIVKVKDGKIKEDSNPYEISDEETVTKSEQKLKKASMSFLTALSLSFNNLLTKKARTILVSIAGSIGIIGIALILSMSNGADKYIKSVEEDALSQYPIQINDTSVDFNTMMQSYAKRENSDAEVKELKTMTGMFSSMDNNDLYSLKRFLDSDDSKIEQFAKSVEYSFDVTPQIYRIQDDKAHQINPSMLMSSTGMNSSMFPMMSMSTNSFQQLPGDSSLYQEQYEVKAGHWPENYNECVVVLLEDGSISDLALYSLGLKDINELEEILTSYKSNKATKISDKISTYTYDDLMNIKFKLINAYERYAYDKEYKIWTDKSDNSKYMKNLVENGEDLTVVGVVKQKSSSDVAMLVDGIAYLPSLTDRVIEKAASSDIVKDQLKRKDIDVFTGKKFDSEENNNNLMMENLFSIDQEALKSAFSADDLKNIDLSNLNMNDMDFNDVDLSGIDFSDLVDANILSSASPSISENTFKELLNSVDINFSYKDMTKLFEDLLNGYSAYAKSKPSTDFSKLSDSLTSYLKTDDAAEIMNSSLQKILEKQGDSFVSSEKLQQMVVDIMAGYPAFAQTMDDPDDFEANFAKYMQTSEVSEKLSADISQITTSITNFKLSQSDLNEIMTDLSNGYSDYAKENNLPEPSEIANSFSEYLDSKEGKEIISSSLTKSIDTSKLSSKIEEMLSGSSKDFSKILQKQIENAMLAISSKLSSSMSKAMSGAMSDIGNMFNVDPTAFAQAINMNMSEDQLKELMNALMSTEKASYEGNISKLGYADKDYPNSILIYPKDFESKDQIEKILDDYNNRMKENGEEDKVIKYTDMVGTLMSSVTNIVDTISYVLVAFVAISLIVSSIMIGVITYISVLERRKEIGILRAIGASKRNIAEVFNAETFIIGLLAGIIGIGFSELLLIPANLILHALTGNADISAILPPVAALLLIVLSIVLTLIGGIIPSKKASRSDPVTALRTE